MKKIALIAFLALIFSACNVVKTNYSEVINQKNRNLLFYYLPETLIRIKAKIKVETFYLGDRLIGAVTTERKYEFTTETISDTRNLLVLEYSKNGLFSDELTFNVNDKGLLTTLKVETKDETATIVETLSKALDSFKVPITTTSLKKDDIKAETKEYSYDFVLKASEVNEIGASIVWIVDAINKNKPDEKFQLNESFVVKTFDETVQVFDFKNLTSQSKDDKLVEGIITRPIRNLKVLVQTQANTEIPNYIQIIDVSKILVLPMKRTAFVKTTNEMSITNGIINTNKITRPSPINGFASIPVNIAKAVVSIPAQLFQIRINNNTNEKNLLTSEKDRLEKELETKIKLIEINRKIDSLSKIK